MKKFWDKISPFSITVIYILVAALWIIFSDQVLFMFVRSENAVTSLQTSKGLIFVSITGVMLYALMRVAQNNIDQNYKKFYREKTWLNKFTESSPSGVIFIGVNGEFSYANDKALKIMDIKAEDFLSQSISSFNWGLKDFDDQDIDEEELPFQQVIRTGESVFDYQHKIITGKGVEKYISVNGAPVNSEDGEIEGVVLTLNDISENIEAEKRLVEQEQRYRALVENSPFGIGIHQEGKLIFVNRAGMELLEAENEEELLGSSIFDIVHEDYRDVTIQRLKELLESGESDYPAEVVYITKKGNEIPVEVYTAPFVYRGKPAIQVLAMDIREKIDRESQLKTALEEQRLMLAEMHHRVKNNLAVISGLMQIQSFDSEREEVRNELELAVRRVKSIAIIHEQLYEASDLKNISFHKNAESLIGMFRSKVRDSNVKSELSELFLNINQAVPCALYLNEVISLMIESSRNGSLGSIEFRIGMKERSAEVRVSVKGMNGIFDKSQRQKHSRSLIDLIARQLEGELRLEKEGEKTEICLCFDPHRNISGSFGSKYF